MKEKSRNLLRNLLSVLRYFASFSRKTLEALGVGTVSGPNIDLIHCGLYRFR